MHTHYNSCASTFQTMTMPMIFSLIEHSFLPVSSIEDRVMFYSNKRILYNDKRKKMNFEVFDFQIKSVCAKEIKISFYKLTHCLYYIVTYDHFLDHH